jgi:hypothetical protein
MSTCPRPWAVADVVAATRRAEDAPAVPPFESTASAGAAGVRRYAPTREQFAELGYRVAALHTIRPHAFGEVAVCSCGVYAVTCTYVALQHQFLGLPVPWDTANPPVPPHWTPA